MFLAGVEQDDTVCFSSHAVNKHPFCSVLNAMFFIPLWALLVVTLFDVAPTCSTQVLSTVLKHQKAVMCLTEKIHVLDKPPSGMT